MPVSSYQHTKHLDIQYIYRFSLILFYKCTHLTSKYLIVIKFHDVSFDFLYTQQPYILSVYTCPWNLSAFQTRHSKQVQFFFNYNVNEDELREPSRSPHSIPCKACVSRACKTRCQARGTLAKDGYTNKRMKMERKKRNVV